MFPLIREGCAKVSITRRLKVMKERDIIQAKQWLDSFQPIKLEAAGIMDSVGLTWLSVDDDIQAFRKTIDAAYDLGDEYDALVNALKKLPEILERMKAFPKSDVREVRRIQNFEVKALNANRDAGDLGLSWVKAQWALALMSSGETDYDVIASKVGLTRKFVERVDKTSMIAITPSGERLDNMRYVASRLWDAVVFCLTQAHKWWAASNKVRSAFWEV